jgi:tRNA(His) guanylyltransferase
MIMDDLGDRIKSYESQHTHTRLLPGVSVYVRLDGRSFSKFTAHMQRPFDDRMTSAMVDTTKYLVDQSGATTGYTCSDEISLGWVCDDHRTQMWFGGKTHKWCSVLASMATIAFAQAVLTHWDQSEALELIRHMPQFDCRVFNVPNTQELANCFLWRNSDAVKNSIHQTAHAHFGHTQLQHKNTDQMLSMLAHTGINWHLMCDSQKTGTFVRKHLVPQAFDAHAWASIPIQHRPSLGEVVLRSQLVSYHLPPLSQVANLPDVLFLGVTPQLKEDT